MDEIYRDGQDVVVREGVYSCEEPKRGDVVLIRRPGRPKERLLKMIVMIPGDRFILQTLSDESFGIFINGGREPLTTPKGRVYKLRGPALSMMKLYQESLKGQVGAGLYFVMGTEPAGTLDSTRFGPVETQDLLGRVIKS
jgi:signal peptidase I